MSIQEDIRRKGACPVLIWAEGIDHNAREQLVRVAHLPVVGPHVAAMPDVHLGIGATVGSVIPTRKAIIPAAVGVDIGCGMVAQPTNLRAHELPDSLRPLRAAIEGAVPVGKNSHAEPIVVRGVTDRLEAGYEAVKERTEVLRPAKAGRRKAVHWSKQLGTLGGGNHFIEVCLDQEGQVWVMLHSGSRNPGNRIGQYWIARAKEQRLRIDGRTPEDKDLSWLDEGTEEFDGYVDALNWAQDFARENRNAMLRRVMTCLTEAVPHCEAVPGTAVNCHHNYVARETHGDETVWVTRKGAINAGEGVRGIIPGSMGTRSYIVRGKGNPESLNSCAHGAGRRMSRTEAKQRYGAGDVEEQTAGVECRKDRGVADEAPGAYKDIERVMELQEDLVHVDHVLKQVLCVKG